jgi:2-polyprenyl-6-hydroxyphenyl methylase/3-demethylubiquinone-9 3-methyltransferase
LHQSFGLSSFEREGFIDVGCGSGLFSLCAKRLGATPVVSIDVDPGSIACATSLRRGVGDPPDWRIVRCSVLDPAFLGSVGRGSRVYAWGVLHHTGAMWDAVNNVIQLVTLGGLLCLGLYNLPNHAALHIMLKRLYNRTPRLARPVMRAAYGLRFLGTMFVMQKRNPIRYVAEYPRNARGMSFWRDVEDWLGGLPCEFAAPNDVTSFVERQGFETLNVLVRPPGANNEYLFKRVS